MLEVCHGRAGLTRKQASDCIRCLESLAQRRSISGRGQWTRLSLRPGHKHLDTSAGLACQSLGMGTVAVLYERADIGAALERMIE